eukprot:PhF_6_TR33017/c0_g1_i1/m.48663
MSMADDEIIREALEESRELAKRSLQSGVEAQKARAAALKTNNIADRVAKEVDVLYTTMERLKTKDPKTPAEEQEFVETQLKWKQKSEELKKLVARRVYEDKKYSDKMDQCLGERQAFNEQRQMLGDALQIGRDE